MVYGSAQGVVAHRCVERRRVGMAAVMVGSLFASVCVTVAALCSGSFDVNFHTMKVSGSVNSPTADYSVHRLDYLPSVVPSLLTTGKQNAAIEPRYDALGMYAYYKWNAAESTPLRFKGNMYIMESVEGRPVGTPWSARDGGSFFRITDLNTGVIICNVSESIGHAFFSAVVDDERESVWVFGAAHHRGATKLGGGVGPCDHTHGHTPHGCYVGAWVSKNLRSWSKTHKTVVFPDGSFALNNDVALVRPIYTDWVRRHGKKLPPFQAIMALEDPKRKFGVAINTGTDGNLGRQSDWTIMWDLKLPAHACPAIRHDPDNGHFYLTGGGSVQHAPYRSLDLRHWETSPLSPITQNSVFFARHGREDLSARDAKISAFYSKRWANLGPHDRSEIETVLADIGSWNWGHSDFDWCCDDGEPPSYLLYMVTEQGRPKAWTPPKIADKPSFGFQAIGKMDEGLIEWLRAYFPAVSATSRNDGMVDATESVDPSTVDSMLRQVQDDIQSVVVHLPRQKNLEHNQTISIPRGMSPYGSNALSVANEAELATEQLLQAAENLPTFQEGSRPSSQYLEEVVYTVGSDGETDQHLPPFATNDSLARMDNRTAMQLLRNKSVTVRQINQTALTSTSIQGANQDGISIGTSGLTSTQTILIAQTAQKSNSNVSVSTTSCGKWCFDNGHAPDACNCGVCGSFGACRANVSCDRAVGAFRIGTRKLIPCQLPIPSGVMFDHESTGNMEKKISVPPAATAISVGLSMSPSPSLTRTAAVAKAPRSPRRSATAQVPAKRTSPPSPPSRAARLLSFFKGF